MYLLFSALAAPFNCVYKADIQFDVGHELGHIADDETVVKLDDEYYLLYLVVDPSTNEFLHITPETSRIDGTVHALFAELREKHAVDDTVFLVDGAIPLNAVCPRHGLGV